jgi:hypothetical protein
MSLPRSSRGGARLARRGDRASGHWGHGPPIGETVSGAKAQDRGPISAARAPACGTTRHRGSRWLGRGIAPLAFADRSIGNPSRLIPAIPPCERLLPTEHIRSLTKKEEARGRSGASRPSGPGAAGGAWAFDPSRPRPRPATTRLARAPGIGGRSARAPASRVIDPPIWRRPRERTAGSAVSRRLAMAATLQCTEFPTTSSGSWAFR